MAKRGLSSMSLVDLQRELRSRERSRARRSETLMRKRASLVKKVRAIDDELADLGVAGRSGARVRPRNESKLADALVQLLTGKTLNVTKIAEAVQQAGYRTTSPNFRTIVNQTLINDKRIKRVGHGEYTAR